MFDVDNFGPTAKKNDLRTYFNIVKILSTTCKQQGAKREVTLGALPLTPDLIVPQSSILGLHKLPTILPCLALIISFEVFPLIVRSSDYPLKYYVGPTLPHENTRSLNSTSRHILSLVLDC
ncbi:hypothetical protein NQ318_003093 [Aromia moschata]|uniref:Uncharacterized protein n=1 Tax=Aromia moschata TaxID=1265417 RepID=A0AAV8XTQ8_9CUCU|nr:hypothetical protein NQ318_003093 [Aromia moschata]